MSLIRAVLDRARARRTAPMVLPEGMPARDRRAALAGLVDGTLVARQVIVAGPAGRIVLAAARRRLHAAVIEPSEGPVHSFRTAAGPTGGFGRDFDAALDAILATGPLTIAFAPPAGDPPDGAGEPADRLRQALAAAPTAAAPPAGDPVTRFAATLAPLAAGAQVLPAPLSPGLAAALDRLAGVPGAPVLVVLGEAGQAGPALALARVGAEAALCAFPRNRLGAALRGWDAALGAKTR